MPKTEVLLSWAKYYFFKLGLTPIPLAADTKQPVLKDWSKYCYEPPLWSTVEKWFQNHDGNIGVVCGKTGDGYNLVCLDFDDATNVRKFFPKYNMLKNQTFVVGSRRGPKICFKTSEEIRKFKIPELKIDVVGLGGQIAVPPSIHPVTKKAYELLSPKEVEPLIVRDLYGSIKNRAEQLGAKFRSEFHVEDKKIYMQVLNLPDDPPCVKNALQGVSHGMRNNTGFALARYFRARGLSDEDALNILRQWNMRNKPMLEERELESIVKSTYSNDYPIGCNSFLEINPDWCDKTICPFYRDRKMGESGKEGGGKKGKNKRLSGGFLDNILFESVLIGREPYYLTYDGEKYENVSSVSYGDLTYTPLGVDEAPYDPYEVDEVDFNIAEDKESLCLDVYNVLKKFVDIPDIWRKIIACMVLMTYQHHKLFVVPYLYIVGDTNSGKTRLLEIIGRLSYRALFGTSIPAADIFTYLENNVDGVICEDEIQGVERDAEKSKIYKSGYKRGAKIPRIMNLPSGRRIIMYYPCFGFKAVAGERLPNNAKGFMERFIVLQMIEGTPEKDEITHDDVEQFKRLRIRLFKWRVQTAFQPLHDVDEPFLKGRVKELFKPILQIAWGTDFYNDILMFLKQLRDEKIREKRESLEGQLTYTVLSLVKRRVEEPTVYDSIQVIDGKEVYIPFAVIWSELVNVLDGSIDVNRPMKMETDIFGDVSKRVVGKRLREILGAKVIVRRDGRTTLKTHVIGVTQLYRAGRKYAVDSDLLKPIEKMLLMNTVVTDVTKPFEEDNNIENKGGD